MIPGVYITSDENDAWEMIERLAVCYNCRHFKQKDLFEGICANPEGDQPFEFYVDNTSACECFYAADRKVKYWIDKLVEMALEAGGVNAFNRQLNYHVKNGTDYEFLGLQR